jgi:hypothetical protein
MISNVGGVGSVSNGQNSKKNPGLFKLKGVKLGVVDVGLENEIKKVAEELLGAGWV